MGRKYIDELENYESIDANMEHDDRNEKWAKEKEIYGFDSRQGWSLDYSMLELLYERLCMFQKDSSDSINTFDVSHIDGLEKESMTQAEIVDEMIQLGKAVLNNDSFMNDKISDKSFIIWELWALVHKSMWW